MWINYVIYGLVFETCLLILAFISDKEGIINNLKLKFLKGYSRLFLVGIDGNITEQIKKTSGRKGETKTITVGNSIYKLEPKMKFDYNRKPAWIFRENIVDPINPLEIQNVEGLDGEFMTGLMEKARLTAQAPLGQEDKIQKLMMIGIFVSAIGSIGSLMLLFKYLGV